MDDSFGILPGDIKAQRGFSEAGAEKPEGSFEASDKWIRFPVADQDRDMVAFCLNSSHVVFPIWEADRAVPKCNLLRTVTASYQVDLERGGPSRCH